MSENEIQPGRHFRISGTPGANHVEAIAKLPSHRGRTPTRPQ